MDRRLFNIAAVAATASALPRPALAQELLAAAAGVMHVSTLLEQDPATQIAELVVAEAYKRLGMNLQVHKYPGERSLVSANDGQTDGELYRKVGMERDYPNLIIVPVPIQIYEIVIFSRDTTFIVNGWESLRPFTIGFVRGIKIVEASTTGMRTEPVPTMQQAFQKLAMGRTDVVVGNRASGLAAARALKMEDIKVLSPALASFPVYHYVHRKHEALVPRLTAAMQQMQKEKVMERIQRQVLGEVLTPLP
ncbi:transporter substrate-binding domain-containing protein [Pseudoduganella ginsengisoli]|uniref:Transporter substrate-binding domain-containing protein n=1 Tax=Pseudoduganella ginsengisoli TaxID=1462440 RepID=A0A6L6Q668_9BURK|nr:transporter substrate-binding domain-containing protein [Pseudoduganella ginsengisoli]MTW05267.1 transporter substrate-binding domain-containing protein [Pseudoduganella ginsengisoli]